MYEELHPSALHIPNGRLGLSFGHWRFCPLGALAWI